MLHKTETQKTKLIALSYTCISKNPWLNTANEVDNIESKNVESESFTVGVKIAEEMRGIDAVIDSTMCYISDAISRGISNLFAKIALESFDQVEAGDILEVLEASLESIRNNSDTFDNNELYCITGAKSAIGSKGITTKVFGRSNNQYYLGSNTAPDMLNRTSYIGSVYGFNIFIDDNIEATEEDTQLMVFFQDTALVYSITEDLDINIELDNQGRICEIVGTMKVEVGISDPKLGTIYNNNIKEK